MANSLKSKSTAVICAMLALVSGSQGNGLSVADKNELDQYYQAKLTSEKMPALSVLVFRKNQIIYEKQFGKSHIQQDIDLQQDHLFLLASVSKLVTATALLQLYEQGKFALDDPINDHLPFTVTVPNFATPITFRMLLAHTSAIADGSAVDDQYYQGTDSPVALDFFLRNYLVPGGNFYNATENFHSFEPGTDTEYSNEGSALIAVLVEQISKKSFNDYCKENIFQPLGMSHTFWRLDEIAAANLRIVQPYEYQGGAHHVIEHYTFTDYPNGGLRSTARDMFSFLRALAMDGISNDHRLLKKDTVLKMRTPQIPALDPDTGLHMFRMNAANNLWGHNGGESGVSTLVAFNPTTQTGAILLTSIEDIALDPLLSKAYTVGLRYRTDDPDGDGVPNDIDLDDDNDGILDSTEGMVDTDGDLIPDSQDLDSDNDGISDLVESGNSHVTDANNDGMADGTVNAQGVITGSSATVANTDQAGLPDYRDLDSDGDGIHDIVENGYGSLDADGDGRIDFTLDGDDDGIADILDANDSVFGFFPGDTPGAVAAGVAGAADLLDYALGTDPLNRGLKLSTTAPGVYQVSVVRPAGRYDVDYTLERSNNLSTWETLTPATPMVTDTGSGASIWKWTGIQLAEPPGDRGFIRLRVSLSTTDPEP